jgi:hypothetical protein
MSTVSGTWRGPNIVLDNLVLYYNADALCSVDQSKTFVKWEGSNIPPSVDNLTTKEGPYTYDEILIILFTNEWHMEPMPSA